MPKSLEKARKQIAKKRNGAMGAIHKGSRDSKRLHRAQVRDERLERVAYARRRSEQPLIDRVAYFRDIIHDNGVTSLALEDVNEHIKAFVHQHDKELDAEKKARRSGRPSSVKEDMLKMKISALEKEHQNGFLIPDLASQENIDLLNRWEGSWSHLTMLSWVRLSKSGAVKPSSFPPKGDH